MLLPKHRVRVLAPQLPHVFEVVFAADGQYYPLSPQLQQLLLEKKERLAGVVASERYAANAVFAQHSSPQRIIQVERQAFFALQLNGLYLRGKPFPKIVGESRIQRHLRNEVVFPVNPLF